METSLSLMKSGDLIKKEPLDYGGFGEVYLCYHKTLGQVVLKTVYTGPPRNGRQKQSLLDEGSLMSRLSHQRVVKLLGVILEDGDYSLVMELIPKGNLLTMLETVPVPISVKGRIILEIVEGMVYLTENQVIHKDLKPENILVDKNFHIKHLKSINTRSTEKSDVYSFSIVVWVILSGREPYESESAFRTVQNSCFFSGMCSRNVQKGCKSNNISVHVTHVLYSRSYEGPEELVEKLKSLTTDSLTPEGMLIYSVMFYLHQQADSPGPLRSSDIGPVEASIEDLSFRTPEESLLEVDAAPPSSPNLELKLAQEYNYHKYGSRIVDQPDASLYNPLPQQPSSQRWAGEASSVKSWTKPAAYPNPNPETQSHPRPASSFEGLHRPDLASQLSVPYSDYDRLQHPLYNRIKSCPDGASPAAESFMLDSHAIQIGSYNTMNLRVSDNSSLSSLSAGSINRTRYNELLMTYEEYTVTENHLEVVRHNVGGNWKQVARKLGLTDIDVDTVEHDYDRDGLAEKVHQMLERWKMKEGLQGITVGKLCHALEGCIKPNVLLQLLLKCQDAAGVP
uniref:Receptor-interacting serine/threonine-protein kinase 1-like n=1 Tax=Sinocyclocheilus grahami TaxID=75366 RepID=A0A672NLA7_SINGR